MQKHEITDFFQTICQNKVIWGIVNDEGMPRIESNTFTDDQVYSIFWTSKEQALAACEYSFIKCKPVAIPILDFVENICIAMLFQDVYAGVIVDGEKEAIELNPAEAMEYIAHALQSQGKTLPFRYFENLPDLLNVAESIQKLIKIGWNEDNYYHFPTTSLFDRRRAFPVQLFLHSIAEK